MVAPAGTERTRPARMAVGLVVDVMLLDYLYDHNPQGSDRADFLGGNLIWIGYTYKHTKDALPARARQRA